MSVPGLEFLFLVFLLSSFFFFVPSLRVRQLLLALLSTVFLLAFVADWVTWLALAAFILSGYGSAILLKRWPNRVALWIYIGVLVSAFVVLKRYEFLRFALPDHWLSHTASIVGLSYMLFRQIHFVVDTMEGQVPEPSLWVYLNYQLNVFTIVAGPIQRYENFRTQWGELRPVLRDRHDLLSAYLRILVGVLKVIVVAEFFESQYENVLKDSNMSRLIRVPVAFYSYPAYVYFNFSGYCSVVIGAASLFGLRVPENFDNPYRARNMIDFWNRWHITLSHWLRDYLFTPIYKTLARAWPSRTSLTGPFSFFVVFLVAGVWHGSTLNFVVFGLLQGFGVSAVKVWENFLIRRGGRKGLKKYLASKKIEVVAIVVNLHFACATFLFFPAGLDRCLNVIYALTTAGKVR